MPRPTTLLLLIAAALAVALAVGLAPGPAASLASSEARDATEELPPVLEVLAKRRRLRKRKPTKKPTRYPTKRHPTKSPTFAPSMHPSNQPTTFAPTPSPSQGAFESCCADPGRQPSTCLAITMDACGARRRLLALASADEDQDSAADAGEDDDDVTLTEAELLASAGSDDDDDDVDFGDDDDRRRRRQLTAPGKIPCMYYFTTYNQLKQYVRGVLRLRGARANRRIRGLFKQQGSFFCRPESGGGCGCHSAQGSCGFSSQYNCEHASIRVGLPDGSTQVRKACTWTGSACASLL